MLHLIVNNSSCYLKEGEEEEERISVSKTRAKVTSRRVVELLAFVRYCVLCWSRLCWSHAQTQQQQFSAWKHWACTHTSHHTVEEGKKKATKQTTSQWQDLRTTMKREGGGRRMATRIISSRSKGHSLSTVRWQASASQSVSLFSPPIVHSVQEKKTN